MFGKCILILNALLFTFVRAAELQEYSDVKKIISRFDSLDSDPANVFSVYFNESDSGLQSRYQFFKDLNKNMEDIHKFGDFPYNPTGEVNQEEYKTLENKANENRNIIIDHFLAIEGALTYLNDILSRYQYMTADDKKEQSTTVIKYILGQTVLPEDSLPRKLPILSSTDCMSWLDSELQLLSFQYENNDPSNTVDYEDYSRINLTQCLNYLAAGYSMLVSAKQANGDDDAETYYNQYSIGTTELIANHEASIRKKSMKSARKTAMLSDMYETDDAFTMSKIVSYIFVISQLLALLLFS